VLCRRTVLDIADPVLISDMSQATPKIVTPATKSGELVTSGESSDGQGSLCPSVMRVRTRFGVKFIAAAYRLFVLVVIILVVHAIGRSQIENGV